MKHLKKIFYVVACCTLALCIFILVIALNPPMSEEIANMLYGEGGMLVSEETPAPDEEETDTSILDVPEVMDSPKMTPIPLFTAEPEATYDPDARGAVYVVTTTLNQDVVTPYVESNDYILVPEAVASFGGYVPVDVELVIQPTPEPTPTPSATPTPSPTPVTTTGPAVTANPAATASPSPSPTPTPTPTPSPTPVPGTVPTPHPEDSMIELEFEDLYFDPLFYPYYHVLDSREQVLYNQIYVHALEQREKVTPYASLPSSVVKNVFEAVYNDHSFTCTVDSDSRVVGITLKYNELKDDLSTAKKTFDLRAGEILAEAKALEGNFEKAKYVHDELLELVTYAEDADLSQTAYSALVNKETVCAGYARAYQYLLQQLGIPCYYCTGYSGMNHAWNIVYLYGDYYNVDVTWDDTDPATYDYFNRTDADLAKTHKRKSLSVYLPACLGTTYRDLAVMEDTEEVDDFWTKTEEDDPLDRELELYYDTCYERIVGNGMGTKEYVDIYSSDMWKRMCEAYESGQISDAFFIRAFHTTGGRSMAMRVQGQVQENGTYKVTHTIVID